MQVNTFVYVPQFKVVNGNSKKEFVLSKSAQAIGTTICACCGSRWADGKINASYLPVYVAENMGVTLVVNDKNPRAPVAEQSRTDIELGGEKISIYLRELDNANA